MHPEQSLNATLRHHLLSFDPVRVENAVGAGTPDINLANGVWIESKIAHWPKRGGIVKCDHFAPQQRAWIAKRWYAGGTVFVVALIDRDYVIMDGNWAVVNFGRVDEKTIRNSPEVMVLPSPLNGDILRGVVRSPRPR